MDGPLSIFDFEARIILSTFLNLTFKSIKGYIYTNATVKY